MKIEITDKDLIKRLNPDGKYTDEYVQSLINIKRELNIRNNKPADTNIDKIDLGIEYSSIITERKYNKEWIEKQVKK